MSEPGLPEPKAPQQPEAVVSTKSARPSQVRRAVWLVVAGLGLLYMALSSGLVSSNDGSHLALARALAVHGHTHIDDEVALTLLVDRAQRDGRDYSDRPPGTGMLAAWAVRLGSLLDPQWRDVTIAQIRANPKVTHVDELVVVRPATDRYLQTYGSRRLRAGARGPNLIALQGTALLVAVHTGLVGALGIAVMVVLLRRRAVGVGGQMFCALVLGAGTLWGPYSTMLFAHCSAATALLCTLLCVEKCAEHSSAEATSSRQALRWGLAAGFAGAIAVSCDYTLAIVVPPLCALVVPVRRWWIPLLGVVPVAVAVGLYHQAAFGSPWSLGYDHHANFAFARDRAATFSGNPLQGLWTLWGAGYDAGILSLSPVLLVGLVGLWLREYQRRWALAMVPWALLLCFHRTPLGGAGSDHRYLIPLVPLLVIGLGLLWQRLQANAEPRARWGLGVLVVLASFSVLRVWLHFFAWRG